MFLKSMLMIDADVDVLDADAFDDDVGPFDINV